jgi:hypothetical protein
MGRVHTKGTHDHPGSALGMGQNLIKHNIFKYNGGCQMGEGNYIKIYTGTHIRQ